MPKREAADMKKYHLQITEAERASLNRWLKNPPKPYLRERARAILLVADARAILLVADGQEGQAVAKHLRVRVHRTTIGEWVKRFQAEGVAGLKIKTGRGRKPIFFPSAHRAGASRGGARLAPHTV